MFRSSDLLAEFERLTRGLNLGAEFDEVREGLSKNLSNAFIGGPGVDAVNTPEAFELHIDLPGVDPSAIDLTIDGHVVTIEANREFTPGDDAEVVHSGRRHGAFKRSFRLGADLDTEALSARSEHGVLVLSVPRSAAAQPRRIEISTGE